MIGIALDEHGWANAEDLIAGIAKTRIFNATMLDEIVATDEKQRYSFNEDKMLIRAYQGHPIPVDVEHLKYRKGITELVGNAFSMLFYVM